MWWLAVECEEWGGVDFTVTVTDRQSTEIRAEGLTPYTLYTMLLMVQNEQFNSSTGPFQRQTSATSNFLPCFCYTPIVKIQATDSQSLMSLMLTL